MVKVGRPPVKGCQRFSKAKELFEHPGRLKFPLKRAGDRGEDRWEIISWEQALAEIATQLREIKEDYGAEAVACTAGTSRTYEELRTRFLNLFGSPNQVGQAQICHGNSAVVASAVYGWWPYWMSTEKLEKTRCVMLIGRNPPPAHQTIWQGVLKAKERGAKLIVIDPRRSQSADAADLWLQLRPGTDCALLMAMTYVIIHEELYDKGFVDKWCYGFDKLVERAKEYPPEKVALITWVPAEQIVAAARMFATERPSCAIEGMGVAHQPHALGALLARYLISAIAGNIDVPGGEELLGPAPFITEHEIESPEMLPLEQRKKMLGTERYRLYTWEGYELIQKNVERVWGKRCDMYGYTCMAHAPSLYRAMATGEPYPVKALITLSSNPMVTQANTKMVYKGLKNLDLYVVMDYFMTPSAQLADYVLPSASWLERDFLFNYHNTTPVMIAGEAALPVTIPGEYDRRTDFDFWRGLGIHLGQEEFWPWQTLEEYYDYRLKPMGLTFKELVKMGKWTPGQREFKKYEKTRFGTPTGKIELYSTILEKLGYDPLPRYEEPFESPLNSSALAEEYPLILITGGRFLPYFHSEHRQVESFRRRYPYPLVEMHPETAQKSGIVDGDWVWIETPRGRVMQRCKYFEHIDPRVVHAQHGWWYPEMPGEEPWLHGVWLSNINVVTDDELDHCDPALGSWPLRTMQCKVYKVKMYGSQPKM
ncbi:molybdopterin-dependent oxidoreductase [Dehalococcoidia bacterium]|nr:molybdopterin-dependent oxidoreductase [Dehalococcoidia bacterium]